MTHPSIHPLVSLSGAFDEDLRVTLDSASVTALESGARKGTVARQGARPGVAGVTIDIGAVVGMASLVTRDVAPCTLVAGTPPACCEAAWAGAARPTG